jgi:hypothetical protein
MICENCGAEIKNRERYCPSCGMEMLIPYSKSLKEKYMAGEYLEDQDTHVHYQKKNVKKEIEHYAEANVHNHDQNYESRAEEYISEQEHSDARDYPKAEEYPEAEYEEESGISILVVIILFLIVALLIGFLIGILIFSGFLHSLPGLSKL